MDKFLDIPITNESNMLLSCTGVISVTVGSPAATKTVITYNSGNTATLTHDSVATDNQMRDSIQDAMEEALKTSWTDVAFAYVPAKAVSAVAVV